MKKLMFTMIALLAMATVTFAQGGGLVYHGVGVVDEVGRPVTSISTVTVRVPGATTSATIYKDRSRSLAITLPMTTTSTNTTLSNGVFYWYGPDGWDYTIGDGTNNLTNYGHDPLTASTSRITFPSYVQAITSTSYADAQSATFGTDSDFVLSAGSTANTMTLLSDNQTELAYVLIGEDEAGIDLKVFGATSGDYWEWDSSLDLFTIVGDAVAWTLTEAAATAVNIDITGAAGGFDLDTTNGAVALTAGGASNGDMTLTAGDAFSVAAVGAIDIDSSTNDVAIAANAAGMNVTIGSVLGSIAITAEENALLAVLITADGGTTTSAKFHNATGTAASATTETDASLLLLSDAGGVGIVSTANLADAIRIEANGGASETVAISSVKGTGAGSIDLDSLVGGITIEAHAASMDVLVNSALGSVKLTSAEAASDAVNIDATGAAGGIDMDTTDGAIALTAAGAANGDMTLTVADKFTLISTDTSAAGIDIEANGGASETIHLHSNQGTSASSIDIISDVGGTSITSSALANGAKTLTVHGAEASGFLGSEGSAGYFSTTVTKNISGKMYNLGSWLDITAGTPTVNGVYSAIDLGVYVNATPTLTNARMYILNMEWQGNSSSAAGETSFIHFNSLMANEGGDAPDYVFDFENPEAACWTANATHAAASTDKVGAIKICVSGNVLYLYAYSSAGQ